MKEGRSSLLFCYDVYMGVVVGHLVVVGATKINYSFSKKYFIYIITLGSSGMGMLMA